MVVGVTTTSEAWTTLQEAFSQALQARILQLQMQLHSIRKGDSLISTFLCKAKLIMDELSAAGHLVPVTTLNTAIFANLGLDYNDIVSSMFVQPTSPTFTDQR